MEIGFFDGLKADIKHQARSAQLTTLTAPWTSQEKDAFSRLERAAKEFFDARERNERVALRWPRALTRQMREARRARAPQPDERFDPARGDYTP